ncbi:probable serine/threonine-protein kinase PIX13 [Zingiber officinale]|uniref:probable serine/threonine-protein kinase PIX13 n=1 Tax=Zingiber officinale TaxID=94328 RepID=UPI001C4BF541|nr:probable serine/threonine-protein kinase PIX13 [Zingiber officinale]
MPPPSPPSPYLFLSSPPLQLPKAQPLPNLSLPFLSSKMSSSRQRKGKEPLVVSNEEDARSKGRSTSRTSGSETTTGKLLNLSSSTTLGESSGNDISVEKVFPEGRILEAPNLRVYTFVKLRSSTRNFKPESFLGEGGFGKVYKGWAEEKTLNPSMSGVGTLVAVKKLNPESVQGLEEWQFVLEISNAQFVDSFKHVYFVIGYCGFQIRRNFLGRLSHPNLVKLLGT